MLNHPRMDFFL